MFQIALGTGHAHSEEELTAALQELLTGLVSIEHALELLLYRKTKPCLRSVNFIQFRRILVSNHKLYNYEPFNPLKPSG
jgi:hypothetical protein